MSTAGRKPEQEASKGLPHSVELEQAFLGETLVKPDLLDQLTTKLSPHHFWDPMHGRIFERIQLRLANGESVVPHVLCADMWDDPGLREVDGLTYLMTMVKAAPGYSRKQFDGLAREIWSLARRRKIVQLGEDISERARSGGEIGSLIDEINRRQAECDNNPDRFRLVPFNDIRSSTECEYLVQGLIPKTGTIVVYGPPKCGKSFWVADLLLHVALGWEYRGRRVKQGVVVYGAFEGGKGFGKRVDAFRQKWLADHTDPVPFYLLPVRVDLIKDHRELIASIERQLRGTGDSRPDAVVLDTLNRSLVGSETDDMGAYIAAADAIRERFDCVVIIVHHCGVDKTRPRGHTSLTGAVDAQIAMKPGAADIVVATVEFMKDGPAGDMIVSRLERVTVGTDEYGDPITSCVVQEADADAADLASAKADGSKKRMPDTVQVALMALHKALAEAGEESRGIGHVPPQTNVTTVEMWRKYAYLGGISGGEERARQQAFKRAVNRLLADNIIAIWNERVWLV